MAGRHEAGGARRKAHRRTETSDYVAMMRRIQAGWGDRVAEDPAALVHWAELVRGLTEETNRGIFEANRSAAHYSLTDIAAILGLTKQAVSLRVRAGEAVYAARAEAAGAGPLVRLADVRARRAAGLRAAGVEDVTGSERERQAR